MESLINTENLSTKLLSRQFQYAKMMDINLPIDEQTPTYQIMTKETGKGHRWQMLSQNGEPLIYPTEKAARADVAKLNLWKKEQKKSVSSLKSDLLHCHCLGEWWLVV